MMINKYPTTNTSLHGNFAVTASVGETLIVASAVELLFPYLQGEHPSVVTRIKMLYYNMLIDI